jgi:hypothetical protein
MIVPADTVELLVCCLFFFLKMQYRGGSELLIEAGDQRRVIKLPLTMQGKVQGAKFVDRNLVVSIR